MGGADGASPYGGAPWGEILAHTAQRLQWTDNSFEMLVFDQTEIGACVCVLLCRSLLHLNLLKRLQWTDDSFEMLVFDQA